MHGCGLNLSLELEEAAVQAFDTADTLEDRREELEQSVERAVKKEDFQVAAAVQAELDSLLQSDIVANIVEVRCILGDRGNA